MKSKRMMGLFLTILFCGIVIGQEKSETDGPRIVFEKEVFDFGFITPDTSITHVFNFINSGTDTLKIKGIRST